MCRPRWGAVAGAHRRAMHMQPTILVVDDLQRADKPSITLWVVRPGGCGCTTNTAAKRAEISRALRVTEGHHRDAITPAAVTRSTHTAGDSLGRCGPSAAGWSPVGSRPQFLRSPGAHPGG